MWRSFFRDKKWFYWSYGGGFFIISLLVLQTYLDVLFNSWYKDFYDILQTAEKREISEFWESIKRFLYINFKFFSYSPINSFIKKRYIISSRENFFFSFYSFVHYIRFIVFLPFLRTRSICKIRINIFFLH